MKFSTSTMYTKLGYVYDKYQVRLDTFLCPENVEHCFQMCQWKFLSSYQNYQNDLTGIVLPNYEQSIVNISSTRYKNFLFYQLASNYFFSFSHFFAGYNWTK